MFSNRVQSYYNPPPLTAETRFSHEPSSRPWCVWNITMNMEGPGGPYTCMPESLSPYYSTVMSTSCWVYIHVCMLPVW